MSVPQNRTIWKLETSRLRLSSTISAQQWPVKSWVQCSSQLLPKTNAPWSRDDSQHYDEWKDRKLQKWNSDEKVVVVFPSTAANRTVRQRQDRTKRHLTSSTAHAANIPPRLDSLDIDMACSVSVRYPEGQLRRWHSRSRGSTTCPSPSPVLPLLLRFCRSYFRHIHLMPSLDDTSGTSNATGWKGRYNCSSGIGRWNESTLVPTGQLHNYLLKLSLHYCALLSPGLDPEYNTVPREMGSWSKWNLTSEGHFRSPSPFHLAHYPSFWSAVHAIGGMPTFQLYF